MCEIAIIHSAIISNLLEYLMVLVSILILLSRIFIELVSSGVLQRNSWQTRRGGGGTGTRREKMEVIAQGEWELNDTSWTGPSLDLLVHEWRQGTGVVSFGRG